MTPQLTTGIDWCAQNDDIPELLSLARTVSRWEDEIVAAVLTGITNDLALTLHLVLMIRFRVVAGRSG